MDSSRVMDLVDFIEEKKNREHKDQFYYKLCQQFVNMQRCSGN